MREIKFRYYFKDKENKIHTLTKSIEDIEYQDDISWNIKLGWELIDRCEYTGLKDKNSKEIYEGDIVKWYSTKATVVFRDGKFTADIHNLFDVTYWKACEIIGNIYENKELLK